MSRNIIVKPLVTEKAQLLTSKRNQYVFVVEKTANKLEIKSEIERRFSVSVTDVNTMIIPGKNKTRSTKRGMIKGRKAAVKKAVVTLQSGESIDLYGTTTAE